MASLGPGPSQFRRPIYSPGAGVLAHPRPSLATAETRSERRPSRLCLRPDRDPFPLLELDVLVRSERPRPEAALIPARASAISPRVSTMRIGSRRSPGWRGSSRSGRHRPGLSPGSREQPCVVAVGLGCGWGLTHRIVLAAGERPSSGRMSLKAFSESRNPGTAGFLVGRPFSPTIRTSLRAISSWYLRTAASAMQYPARTPVSAALTVSMWRSSGRTRSQTLSLGRRASRAVRVQRFSRHRLDVTGPAGAVSVQDPESPRDRGRTLASP